MLMPLGLDKSYSYLNLQRQKKYTVRSGDTLYTIALPFNTTVSRLATLNRISNVGLIRIGQIIQLPYSIDSTRKTIRF